MSIAGDVFAVVAWVLLAGMTVTVTALKARRFEVRLGVYLTVATVNLLFIALVVSRWA